MERNTWYLLAYDVADPKRLQRVHRRLCRSGLRVQKSVFLVSVTPSGLVELLDEIEGLMHRREDDLRAYPIDHPGEIWFQGRRALAGPLLHPGQRPLVPPPEVQRPRGFMGLIGRLGRR